MKTIIENETNLSKYLLGDDVPVFVAADHIAIGARHVIGSIKPFIVSDLNSSNATVVEGLDSAPSDWVGNKYTYDVNRSASEQWKENPSWVDAGKGAEE